jgi:hypothetical protein
MSALIPRAVEGKVATSAWQYALELGSAAKASILAATSRPGVSSPRS